MCAAAARALMRALAANVTPSFDRFGAVVPDDLEVGAGRGDDRLELLDLCGLCVARTTRAMSGAQGRGLQVAQLRTAVDAELEQLVELALVERRTLGGALHLDERPRPVTTTFMSVSARTSST